jgi:hypothetical protein
MAVFNVPRRFHVGVERIFQYPSIELENKVYQIKEMCVSKQGIYTSWQKKLSLFVRKIEAHWISTAGGRTLKRFVTHVTYLFQCFQDIIRVA